MFWLACSMCMEKLRVLVPNKKNKKKSSSEKKSSWQMMTTLIGKLSDYHQVQKITTTNLWLGRETWNRSKNDKIRGFYFRFSNQNFSSNQPVTYFDWYSGLIEVIYWTETYSRSRSVLFVTSVRVDTIEKPYLSSWFRKKWIFVNSLFRGLTVNWFWNSWSQNNEAR